MPARGGPSPPLSALVFLSLSYDERRANPSLIDVVVRVTWCWLCRDVMYLYFKVMFRGQVLGKLADHSGVGSCDAIGGDVSPHVHPRLSLWMSLPWQLVEQHGDALKLIVRDTPSMEGNPLGEIDCRGRVQCVGRWGEWLRVLYQDVKVSSSASPALSVVLDGLIQGGLRWIVRRRGCIQGGLS